MLEIFSHCRSSQKKMVSVLLNALVLMSVLGLTGARYRITPPGPSTLNLCGQMFTVTNGGELTMYTDPIAQSPSRSPYSSPSPSSTSYPYTSPSPSPSSSPLTVCLRYMAEEGEDLTFFSLTQGNNWNLLLKRYYWGMDHLSIDSSQDFSSYKLFRAVREAHPWTSLCVTWEKKTGMAQVWRGGTVSVRKRVFGQVTNGPPVLKVFKFEGQVTDVEVWDRVLSPSWILAYMSGWQSYWSYTPGNVLTWSKAIYSTNGEVLLERNTYNSDHQPISGHDQRPGPIKRKTKTKRKFEWRKSENAEQRQRAWL
ncbi:jeltraxin-like [Oncorhynchus keta]|uniref:jeltraxin-like n=1 Tax=Oncorhynchus keta TaxID=8018 RepID=UPI00227C74C1|nr:jeltraxin-like [Oncorhynchus keta]